MWWPAWIVLFASIILWHVFNESTDTDTDVMLPFVAYIACNPWLLIVLARFCDTAYTANNLGFVLRFFGLLRRFLGRFFLRHDGFVKYI